MKKVFLTLLTMATIATVSTAQEVATTKQAPKTMEAAMQPKLTKEQKEAQLLEAFKKADLTEEQQKKAREIMDAAGDKAKAIKTDAKLGEDEKKMKFDEINKDKNDRLKEAMGEVKYKAFQQARKYQKEAAAKTMETTAPIKE